MVVPRYILKYSLESVGGEDAMTLFVGGCIFKLLKVNPSTRKTLLAGGVLRPTSVPSKGGAVLRGITQNSLLSCPGSDPSMKTIVRAFGIAAVRGALNVIVLPLIVDTVVVEPT